MPPVTYPLPGIVSNEIRGLLGDLLAGAGLADADLKALKDCLLDDLTDEVGEVLPIQAALAFQGLASLDYLTPRYYRRKGGLRGLQVAHVRRGMLHFAQLLRIDRRTACAFFRRMVDHGSPPKTIAVPSSALASQVARQEREVLDQLRALAKPAFRIVRERIEATDAQGSEWSLYHDFLAPIVLEVQRQLDSANALLEQKHTAFRSANGWWAKWTASFLPGNRSAWHGRRCAARSRRPAIGAYCLASTLRLLPYAALWGVLWVGSLAYRDQIARGEAQKVVSAIGAVSDLSEPPAGGELEQIGKLARAKWPMKEQFIRDLVQSPMTPDRFAQREEYLTHAIVGMDPSHQTRNEVPRHSRDGAVRENSRFPRHTGIVAARIFASDPERFAPEANLAGGDLVEAMRATTDPYQLSPLAQGLAGLAEKIDPKLSAPLAEKIVEAMRATTDPDQLSYLAQGLAGLAEKIDPKLSAQLAEKIVEAMRATTDPDQLSSLAQGLAGLAEKIDPKLSRPGSREDRRGHAGHDRS